MVGGGCAQSCLNASPTISLRDQFYGYLIDLGSQLSSLELLLVTLNRFLGKVIKKRWEFLSKLDKCTLETSVVDEANLVL